MSYMFVYRTCLRTHTSLIERKSKHVCKRHPFNPFMKRDLEAGHLLKHNYVHKFYQVKYVFMLVIRAIIDYLNPIWYPLVDTMGNKRTCLIGPVYLTYFLRHTGLWAYNICFYNSPPMHWLTPPNPKLIAGLESFWLFFEFKPRTNSKRTLSWSLHLQRYVFSTVDFNFQTLLNQYESLSVYIKNWWF